MAIKDFYESGLTIETRSTAAAYGGNTWSILGTDYKGFVQPLSSNDTFKQGKSGDDITHRFYTYVSTPAEYGYRLTWQGVKYIMTNTVQPSGISSVQHHKEILLRKFTDAS